MSEQIKTVERIGFDRRDALKKAAVAGGIVWATPMLTSHSATAANVCTLKCAAKGPSVTFNVQGRKLSCVETPGAGGAPGKVTRVFRVDSVTVQNASTAFPCGGNATATISQTTFTFIDPVSNQGVRFVTIGTATVTITCLDRQGRPVRTTCTVDVQARFSGSCQGDGNTRFQFTNLRGCSSNC